MSPNRLTIYSVCFSLVIAVLCLAESGRKQVKIPKANLGLPAGSVDGGSH